MSNRRTNAVVAVAYSIISTIPLLALLGAPSFAADSKSTDITNRIQEMRTYSEQEKLRQDRQQYKDYLKNNDFDKGITQKSGPTGNLSAGGGSVGYKWSTK